MVDLGDLYERADAIGKKAAKKAYDAAYRDALTRLERSKPIIDALQQHDIQVLIGNAAVRQKGVYIVIEVEPADQIFISRIERITDTYLDRGTIIFPHGFAKDAYAERLEMMAKCRAILEKHRIESELIKNTEEGLVILYVPSTPA